VFNRKPFTLKTAFVTVILFAAAGILLLLVLAAVSRSGKPPGLVAGKLSNCPDKPNCVCSEQRQDAVHYLQPFTLQSAASPDPLTDIKAVIVDMGGVIRQQHAGYIAAAFSSPVFGFVDDVEIRVDAGEGLLHIRSASRVGYGDAGVNRKRLEQLRKLYAVRVAVE
jgi:uncharacterized protein (DUF1499 family)